MVSLSVTDLHEPWIKGDPEIAIHTAIRNESTGEMEWVSCSGDGYSSSSVYYFDMNDQYFLNGSGVKLAAESDVTGKKVEHHVWEDDYQRCDGFDHLEPHTNESLLDDLILLSTTFFGDFDGSGGGALQWNAYSNLAIQAYLFATAADEDDYIGLPKEIPTSCFTTETGPVWFSLENNNGSYTGYIRIDNTDDIDRELCDPEDFDPVEVYYIDGPTQIPPSAAEGCGYSAFYAGGAGYYEFEWRWDDEPVGNDFTWVPSGGLAEGYHLLKVSVFDTYTATGDEASLWVHVDSGYSCF